MASYQELVQKYTKRRHDTLTDAVVVGLSYADNVAVDLGLVEDCGVLTDGIDAITIALPFAVIAATEGFMVIFRKKDAQIAMKDGFVRAVKTAAAMGIGAAVGAAMGAIAAVPAAMATRSIFDHYKSKSLTVVRVKERTVRLKALRIRHHDQIYTNNETKYVDVVPMECLEEI